MKKRYALLLLCLTAQAQAETTDPLEQEILAMDQRLFTAFNQCDVEGMGQILDPSLEFYHDKGGLTDYQYTLDALRGNCERQLGLKRELIADSNQVYPIKDFGAIQQGRHTFCHIENGKNDCGTFQFMNIWQNTDTGWKVVRIVSYDH